MSSSIEAYLKAVNTRYNTGIAREHSYRGDLQILVEALLPDVLATNEPARIHCGAPDFILTKRNSRIDVGYIEAKDVGKPLDDKSFQEQFDRYRQSLGNLIITDYLDFRLYRNSDFVTSLRIADLKNGKIVPIPENYNQLGRLFQEFGSYNGQTITSALKLAEMMANKAKLLAKIIENSINSDEEGKENTTLREQMDAFRDILLHDIDAKGFSDIYAQTIAYGMFAARLHDPTPKTFTRQEAAQLIPHTNPFLRKLFQYISGYDIDSRIEWIVDALAEMFRATDIKKIMKDFGKATHQADPMIHFYETFLSEYDPGLRKSRGVWYTPEPVVKFIVRAVDDVLKRDFGLSQGLADTSKTRIKITTQGVNKRTKKVEKVEVDVHRVQILDPATGTGTFLAEVLRYIHNRFKGQSGVWSKYVSEHVIPRLNGFEILMASYAMAHLKLDLILQETGYNATNPERLRVYLTNALEEHHPDTGTLFASWLSAEANEANYIKRDTPVMVVLGNPPYSGHSVNLGDWIVKLISNYKKEPNSTQALQERNSKWLNDDYVKFIRLGEHAISRNGNGILAYINNHSFLDNPTFRGMRWSLLNSFDKIYIIDLHGNSKKKERAPDGGADKNVFDIQQGVSINIFVKKTGNSKSLAEVLHLDLWGARESKYDFLTTTDFKDVVFKEINPRSPFYFFSPRNSEHATSYEAGFSLSDLFKVGVLGYQTHRDRIAVDSNRDALVRRIDAIFDPALSLELLDERFSVKSTKVWSVNDVRKADKDRSYTKGPVAATLYRPFDVRYCCFDRLVNDRPRPELIKHLIGRKNLQLLVSRQVGSTQWSHVFVSNLMAESCVISSKTKEQNYNMPLYLYSDTGLLDHDSSSCMSNLNTVITSKIESALFSKNRKQELNDEDIFFYVYAVLHSPAYRLKYFDQLRSSFPRIPYPSDPDNFVSLSKLGQELVDFHLMNDARVEDYITAYPVEGDDRVERSITDSDWSQQSETATSGRVWINDCQYFESVPSDVWELYLGGNQPARKWLKDRKGTELSFDDIMHYQKIIVVLSNTIRIMSEIDILISDMI